jgi:hypothetical protein
MRYVEWDEQYLAISSTEWLRRCGKYELPRRSMVLGLLVAADGVWAKYKFRFFRTLSGKTVVFVIWSLDLDNVCDCLTMPRASTRSATIQCWK